MSLRNRMVLPVVFSALAVLSGCGGSSNSITNPVAPPSGGFSKSSLNGTYVFSVSGTDTNGAPYAMVGSFTANGSGGITGGTLDLNDEAFASSSPVISPVANSPISSSSSYSVGVDGRGQAQLQTSTPFKSPIVLDFVLQDSSHGLVTEFDNTASGSGSLDLQSSGTTPNGSYAFIFSGAYGSTLLATVGNFTVGAGGAVTGLEDFNSEGVPYPDEALSGTVVAGPSSTPATQLVAASTSFAITYDVYPIDATHLKFIEMDASGTLSGDAYSQTSGAAVPTGTLAFTLMGATTSQVIAAGGFMITDGNGNITTASTADVNNTGSVSASFVTFSGTYAAAPASSGRSTLDLTSFVVGSTYAAYPSSGGLLLLEIDASGMMAGAALQQSSIASLAASQGYALGLSGTNLGAATGSSAEVDDIAEFATAASGLTLTGVTDENYDPSGVPNYGLALSGTYAAPDSNGRGQLAANAGNNNNGTLNGGFSITYYTVDGTTFPFIETDSGQVTSGVFLTQNSSSSSSAATRPHLFVMPPLVRPRLAKRQK